MIINYINKTRQHCGTHRATSRLKTAFACAAKTCLYVFMSSIFVLLSSCENGDVEFPDFDYQTVYFARQTPIRTIVLGNDEVYPNDLDNAHKCQIYAVMGGVNENKKTRTIQIAVDNSLCDNLQYSDGRDVKPMPAEYYELSSNTITIQPGQIMGCVDVQLTDAFFADTLNAVKSTTSDSEATYVIPIRMVSATDSILESKNYVLYAVNYKNKYHGCWLSQGTDVIKAPGKADSTITRQPGYWEYADLVYLTTDNLQQSRYSVSTNVEIVTNNGRRTTTNIETKTCSLILTFDSSDHCTISTDTPGCTATGSGQWTSHGAAQAWGDKDRDQLTLQYEVTFTYESGGETVSTTLTTNETLVMRDRQSKLQDFSTK